MKVVIRNGYLFKINEEYGFLTLINSEEIAVANGFDSRNSFVNEYEGKKLKLNDSLVIDGIIDELDRETILTLLNRYGCIDKLCSKRNLNKRDVESMIDKYGFNGRMVWS